MAAGNGEIRIKRELEEDPLDICELNCKGLKETIYYLDFQFSAPSVPVAPKVIRRDDNTVPAATNAIRLKPIAPRPVQEPDYFMLNKPPPISFNLPKEAALVNRNVQEDPMNQPPEIALQQLEDEARKLKEEVAALKWLAKRKEQEWNSILTLLKKKEENWLKLVKCFSTEAFIQF